MKTAISFKEMDLTGRDLREMDLTGADFQGANLTGVNLRKSILKGANFKGANLLCTNLEYADLTDIIVDENTRHYRMNCPETGAFVGYKKCFNDRIVQLLIPADAKRCSATNPACRCSKAKVLSIKSIDSQESYEEATSFVDENFVYRVGNWVEVSNFNEDRWMDSTTGIHFWMTREGAIGYM
ncbi:MAG: pentapeptide repeat-containing protein [Lachnospiraceae bacterium]